MGAGGDGGFGRRLSLAGKTAHQQHEGGRSPDSTLEVAQLALKLGLTAFGGPAAHIAMLRDEIVTRRQWMTDAYFLDLLAATNLIPGPNSTEMVIHSGYHRAGRPGLVAAGACFILPAALITLAFAWVYGQYGTTPQLESFLYGVKPVVIAVIVQAIWGLGRTIANQLPLLAVALIAFVLSLAGVNELVVLLGLGVAVMALRVVSEHRHVDVLIALPALNEPLQRTPDLAPLLAAAVEPYSPLRLFLEFLKIGATLYGSGYVLLSFLQQDFVENLGWLTEQQLLDAVAVGQFTPGPVFTTATFVGYLVGGWGGAALATIGIFVPAFMLVGVTHPLVPKLRNSPWTAGFLDGVSAAAVGLMASVTVVLGQAALVGPYTIALALVAALLLIRFRVNSAWLIVGGGVLGVLGGAIGI
ncbi:MAG: chromate efflux transporter [Thermomicrobiales bacterium]